MSFFIGGPHQIRNPSKSTECRLCNSRECCRRIKNSVADILDSYLYTIWGGVWLYTNYSHKPPKVFFRVFSFDQSSERSLQFSMASSSLLRSAAASVATPRADLFSYDHSKVRDYVLPLTDSYIQLRFGFYLVFLFDLSLRGLWFMF